MMGKEIKIQLVLDDKNIEAKILNADKLVEGLRHTARSTTDVFKNWATVTTGLNQGLQLAQEIIGKIGDSVMKGAKLDVLRANFQGTTEDIELFRQATAGTVSEANLIKLSNQATDLGISLKDQAKFFALAEDAGDKYGVGVEEAFQQVVLASEGNIRGLKNLGIQKKEYEQLVEELAEASGVEIEQLDAEAQKYIRLQAILQLSGISLEDVKNKTQDNADKLESLGVRVEEAETKMGSWITNAIVPLIDSSGSAGTSILAIGSAAVSIIPLLGSLKVALEGVNLKALGIVGIAIGVGKSLDALSEKYLGIAAFDQTVAFKNFVMPKGNIPMVSPREVKTTMGEETPPGFDFKEHILPNKKEDESKRKKAEEDALKRKEELVKQSLELEEIQREAERNALEEMDKMIDEESNSLGEFFQKKWDYFEEDRKQLELNTFSKELETTWQMDLDDMLIEKQKEKSDLLKEFIETDSEIKREELEQEADFTQQKIDMIQSEIDKRLELSDIAIMGLENLGSAFDQFASIQTANVQGQISEEKKLSLQQLKNRYDDLKSKAVTEEEKKKLDKMYNDEKEKIERQADERGKSRVAAWYALSKTASISQAIIKTYEAANLALASSIPPWNFILAGTVIAAGLANVASIAAQPLPSFEIGGLINGKRHSTGGVMINAEGGEFIVNRESTRSNIELLEAINAGRNISVQGMGNNRDVVMAIDRLGSRIEKLEVVAKLYPKEFDEGITDYNLRKEYTGG